MDRLGGSAPFRVEPPAWTDLRGTLPSAGEYALRTLADIRYVVIHHSGVNADSSARSIAEYHVQHNGWPGIGYSFVVRWDGSMEYASDILRCSYNVASRNRECLGVCLPGNWTDDVPGDAQLGGALELVTYLRGLLPWAVVVGHSEVALPSYPSSCPGYTWPAWRSVLT